MSAAAKLLDRLPRLKQTRPDNFIAGCPCCQSRNGRPVKVRTLDDGRVLLHAFCGCETGDVLAAIGLSFSDLFDKPLAHHLPPVRGGFTARELLELNSHEATVAALLADIAQTRPLTEEESQRLAEAAGRLATAHGLANG